MIRTPRLILRQWRASDLPAYAALNADPEVRRWYPDTLDRAESDEEAAEFGQHIEEHGFGFWAVGVPGIAPFIGFTGLHRIPEGIFFAPAVEVGWRLDPAHWGKGYATEAARAALAYGFGPLGLEEILAYSVADNAASRRVMDRIGMQRDAAGDFDLLAGKHGALLPAVLYRLQRTQWSVTGSAAGVEFIPENGAGAGVRLRKAE